MSDIGISAAIPSALMALAHGVDIMSQDKSLNPDKLEKFSNYAKENPNRIPKLAKPISMPYSSGHATKKMREALEATPKQESIDWSRYKKNPNELPVSSVWPDSSDEDPSPSSASSEDGSPDSPYTDSSVDLQIEKDYCRRLVDNIAKFFGDSNIFEIKGDPYVSSENIEDSFTTDDFRDLIQGYPKKDIKNIQETLNLHIDKKKNRQQMNYI